MKLILFTPDREKPKKKEQMVFATCNPQEGRESIVCLLSPQKCNVVQRDYSVKGYGGWYVQNEQNEMCVPVAEQLYPHSNRFWLPGGNAKELLQIGKGIKFKDNYV